MHNLQKETVSYQTGHCCGSPTVDWDLAHSVPPDPQNILENEGENVSRYAITMQQRDRFPDAFTFMRKTILGVLSGINLTTLQGTKANLSPGCFPRCICHLRDHLHAY